MPFIASPDGTLRYSEPPDQDRHFDYDVYVGHSQADQKSAEHIIEVLSKSGLKIYNSSRAWSGPQAGDTFGPLANVAITLNHSRWYLLLASPNAAASEFVDQELRYWIAKKGVDGIVIGLIRAIFQKDVLPTDHVHSLAKTVWLDLRNFSQSDTGTVGLLLDAFHERSKPLGEFTQFLRESRAQERALDEFTQFFGKSRAQEPISDEHEAAGGDLHRGPGDYLGREPGGHSTAEERPVAPAAASPPALGSRGREEELGTTDTGNSDEVPDQATVDQLQFSVTAPRPLWLGESHEIFFWAHLESQLSAILRRLKERLGRTQYERLATISQGPYRVRRGTVLTVELSVQDLFVHHSTKSVLWNGKCGNAVFVVEVPKGVPLGNRVGTFSVLVEGLELASVDFTVQIGTRKQRRCRAPAKSRRHKQAFASYASEDRAAVFARVQGMSKVAPDMKVFLDVLDLRSGQNWEQELWRVIPRSNVFYLFWSEHASRSEWVEKEWRCAYTTRGLGFIDPVPLQSPQVAPPPKELSAKHFNDIWIHYIESIRPIGITTSTGAGRSGIGDATGPGPG